VWCCMVRSGASVAASHTLTLGSVDEENNRVPWRRSRVTRPVCACRVRVHSHVARLHSWSAHARVQREVHRCNPCVP
jgi:hypothetical protein